jgi:cytochrome c oxidase subunit 1
VPGIDQDFVPQTVSAEELEHMRQRSEGARIADVKT